MKVAVISLRESLGKSHLIATLASLYSRSQNRSVGIMSTGNIKDNVDLVDIKVKDDALVNTKLFRAQIIAATSADKSLLDGGLRQGDEDVFIFNIMDATLTENQQIEFFKDCIKKVPVDFCIIEICGDLNSPINKAVIESVDCFLVLTDVSLKGFEKVKEYSETIPVQLQMRTGYILSKYDANVVSEKKIYKTTKLNSSETMIWPYSSTIAKLGYDGLINESAQKIMRGSDGNLIPIRERLMEMLRFIFNSDDRKIIREVNKW